MANDEHVAMLKKGVAAWNAWRVEDPAFVKDPSTLANFPRASLGWESRQHLGVQPLSWQRDIRP
jgi:hypothetical protein